LTQRYTARAVDFIQRAKDSSFFLYLAHNAPHLPLFASKDFRGKSGMGFYADVVAEIDWSLGEILGALESAGVDQNTLVLFSSDHGPWFNGNAGGLRGRKGETWEGGMRVPFIARFPGLIPAASDVSSVAAIMDVLPTVAAATGAPLPGNRLDGQNLWPVMTGSQDSVQRDPILYFDGPNLQCARVGRWKLHLSRYNTFPWTPDPVGGRKNLPLLNPELYDVQNDPGESYDCAPDNPQIVADIRAAINQMLPAFPQQVQSAWNDTFRQQVQFTWPGELPILQTP
jgi:arylsulfatase